MSASVTLSPSVRQNLLSLQNTASLMLTTQTRLATGKKVNSALDNASSFFTAASLNNRANALNSVLDSVSTVIQIFAAANNGLTGITHLLESMQAVLNQTGQSQTNQAASYGIGTIDTSSVQNMSFSGGSVGASPVQVALNTSDVTTPATAATVTASADYVAPTAVSGAVVTTGGNWLALGAPNADETWSFTVSKNGGPGVSVQLAASDGSFGMIGGWQAIPAINADLAAGGSTIRIRSNGNPMILGEFYDTDAANTGTTATSDVSDVTTGGTAPSGHFGWEGGALHGQGTNAANRVVTIGDGTTTATATLTTANAATAAAARVAIQAAIDATALVGTISVGGSANRIDLAGLADGSNNITFGGANVDDVLGAGRTVTPGSTGSTSSGTVKTVDQLASDINANAALTGKVHASNAGGKLSIENISGNVLTVTGVIGGNIDGSGTTATIAGASTGSVSGGLVTQFNGLRTQLDKLAGDSYFNGVNLLNGDNLNTVFNEQGTSSLSVTRRDAQLGRSRPHGAFGPEQQRRYPARRPHCGAGHSAYAGGPPRFVYGGLTDPRGLHQEHGEHVADRLQQPGARRSKSGRLQSVGVADAAVAVDHRALACQPVGSGRA